MSMKKNPRYPLKHLSVRVPWHDNAWNGTICNDPKKNGACLILKNCSKSRDDEKEQSLAGKSIEHLSEDDFPVCVAERGTFMSPFGFTRELNHPYVERSPNSHGHLKGTKVYFPAYSAAAVPYYWTLKENAKELSKIYDLDFDEEREPQLAWEGKDSWVQEFSNQKALLNCFFEHFEETVSLVFFYAKQVPFVEQSGRVLVGVGKVNKIIPSKEYEGSNKKFAAAYWEYMILHSIRTSFDDGFLLPYHEALEYQKEHPDFNPASLAVIIPSDIQFEFSYASGHVSSDSAIRVLLKTLNAIERAEELGIGKNHRKIVRWIQNELSNLQKLRGFYPGMGAALCAFGIEKGHFVAAEIISKIKDDQTNPWRVFEKVVEGEKSILSSEVGKLIPEQSRRLYKKLRESNSIRLDLLHLLSRFDISIDQAKILYVEEERDEANITLTEEEILRNPYLIYEATIRTHYPVALETIDLGMFLRQVPEDLLPKKIYLTDPLHSNRIRALIVEQLTAAASAGHTFLPRKELIKQIRHLSIEPKCELNSDYCEIAEEVFDNAIIVTEMRDGSKGYQLKRLADCGSIIRQKVHDRVNAKRHKVDADWKKLLDDFLKKFIKVAPDEEEEYARKEKVAALKEIAESRFSVLIGSAGTGKTTLLTVLASHPEIEKRGVLLLAPTGKARVRMQEIASDVEVTAKTLAQFLKDYDRYDGGLQLYKLSDKYCVGSYDTVILDEASMLTEEMLATALDCLQDAKRFILVGDHRQLPPIGSGRPFVDIIRYLQPENVELMFPRIGKGYAELTVKRRQGGSDRVDIQLAEWFSGEPLEVGADKVFEQIRSGQTNDRLRLISWENESDFPEKFEEALIQELRLQNIEDVKSFNICLGSADGRFFNSTRDATYFKVEPSVNSIESWQILSPVKEKTFGVRAINRRIHQLFRKQTIAEASGGIKKQFSNGYEFVSRPIPKPVGIEQIVYGDKVINLSNHTRDKVYPKDNALQYLANGEIGLVTGQYKRKNAKFQGQPKFLEIEFSSQKGFVYTFTSSDFKEEGDPPLELAYALTVHKAQGSEFDTVFLIIPNPCFNLTRELLYTALTRQRQRVVVLYQGSLEIKKMSFPRFSETVKRITNLFDKPDILEIDDEYYSKDLIHQASDGEMLRSKSELLIYQRLLDKGIKPIYEKELELKEVKKLPDFTIENPDTGEVYYWEHCGMLHDPKYRKRWEEKYRWYLENDILPIEQGKGKNGTLIISEDKPVKVEGGAVKGAISVKEIDETIRKIFGR